MLTEMLIVSMCIFGVTVGWVNFRHHHSSFYSSSESKIAGFLLIMSSIMIMMGVIGLCLL